MSTRQKRPNKLNGLVVPTFCLLATAYFLHHAFQGNLGIFARAEMNAKTHELRLELARVTAQREKLETRVALLRAGTIEKDMLDEQARFHLNVLRQDEIMLQRDIAKSGQK